MVDELQQAVDELAALLGRSVYVDDPRFVTLATSRQVGAIDEPRVRAVLDREPDPRHLGYFRSQGVTRMITTLRIPAEPELGLLARVVVPVRAADRLLARLWLIDAEPPLSTAEVSTAEAHVAALRASLERRDAADEDRTATATRLLDALTTAGHRQRTSLVTRLAHQFGHEATGLRTARVDVTPGSGEQVRSRLVSQPGLADIAVLAHDDHVVLLLGRRLQAPELLDPLLRRAMAGARRVHCGIGTKLGETVDVAGSLSRATFAARVARRHAEGIGTRAWDDLGELRMFHGFEWGPAGVADLDPTAALLLTDGRGLGATVMAYLEREGDVAGAARDLCVHRTTLYHRLGLASHVMGTDLSGHGRLRLHAALRFASLCCPEELEPRRAR